LDSEDLERVTAAAVAVTGVRDGLVDAWLDTPIPELDDFTPRELVGAGRADAVLAYLESIEAGSTG
jgi:uncharacterized protein (DUF2384 family)